MAKKPRVPKKSFSINYYPKGSEVETEEVIIETWNQNTRSGHAFRMPFHHGVFAIKALLVEAHYHEVEDAHQSQFYFYGLWYKKAKKAEKEAGV